MLCGNVWKMMSKCNQAAKFLTGFTPSKFNKIDLKQFAKQSVVLKIRERPGSYVVFWSCRIK